MRLLLDEHLSRRIAAELRRRGHDVVAASEREDLRELPDVELFAFARADRRAIVTQDYADFSRLLEHAAVDESEHVGVIFVPPSLWRSLSDLDRLVAALHSFLEEHPAEDALFRGAAWLVS